MRTEKELLIILRNRIKTDFTSLGLCYEVSMLYYAYSLINYTEKNILKQYILNHRPKRGKHFHSKYTNSLYFWPEGETKPRIEWLNSQIKNYHLNR